MVATSRRVASDQSMITPPSALESQCPAIWRKRDVHHGLLVARKDRQFFEMTVSRRRTVWSVQATARSWHPARRSPATREDGVIGRGPPSRSS